MFSNSLDQLIFLKRILYGFLISRGLRFSLSNIKSVSLSLNDSLEILDWQFFSGNLNTIFVKLSISNIKSQKLKLKLLIKNHGNLNVCSLIDILNQTIFDWSKKYSVSDFYLCVSSELDIYLYKILWRWARKRHPRRTNVWVYNKYWRFFLGSWRFFSLNDLTGNIIFLRSHIISTSFSFRLPLSCNNFDLLNMFKFRKVCTKKFYHLFQGVARLLWYKQNGICFVCKKSFMSVTFNAIKIQRFNLVNKKFSNLIMLHNYCFLGCECI